MRNIIDAKSIEIVSNIINEWAGKFKCYSYEFGEIKASNNDGDENTYFSEIETYIWKGSNVEAVFNIILYLDGKLTMKYDELINETNSQLQEILTKLVNKNFSD